MKILLLILTTFLFFGCAEDGKDGIDGTNGVDGKDGIDGTNVVVYSETFSFQLSQATIDSENEFATYVKNIPEINLNSTVIVYLVDGNNFSQIPVTLNYDVDNDLTLDYSISFFPTFTDNLLELEMYLSDGDNLNFNLSSSYTFKVVVLE